MDLSHCNVSSESLEVILSRCSALTHLSLESLELELGELETGPRGGGDTDGPHHEYTQVSTLGVG